jgi:hypothetical protein
LLRAQEYGLVHRPNIKVKDKGDMVKVDEVVADPTRVVMALQLFGPDDFYYMVAFFPEPLQTDSITLEGQLTQLGNEIRNIPVTRGDWSYRFSIDMKEARKQTKVTSFEGSYTSPDGMTIRLKRLTQMV